jgi:hypothetical protein
LPLVMAELESESADIDAFLNGGDPHTGETSS